MADTTYEVTIQKVRENDGAAYLRAGAEPGTETLTLKKAREQMGEDRVVGLLLNAIDAVRRSSTK